MSSAGLWTLSSRSRAPRAGGCSPSLPQPRLRSCPSPSCPTWEVSDSCSLSLPPSPSLLHLLPPFCQCCFLPSCSTPITFFLHAVFLASYPQECTLTFETGADGEIPQGSPVSLVISSDVTISCPGIRVISSILESLRPPDYQ